MASYVHQVISDNGLTLLIYNGIELTLSDAAQCLAIFDPATSEDDQKALLSKLGNIVPSHRDAAKTCEIGPAAKTVAELFEEVEGEGYLRERCVLLPHVSVEDAHKSLNRLGFHPRFANLECDGVYIERSFDSLDDTTKDKIQGRIKDWGTRRKAIVSTGDNKSAALEPARRPRMLDQARREFG